MVRTGNFWPPSTIWAKLPPPATPCWPLAIRVMMSPPDCCHFTVTVSPSSLK